MKLLSITGSEKDLDKFIAKNLLDTDIQIEDAKKIYNKGWKLEYYDYNYQIKDNIKKCKDLLDELNILYREEYSNLYIENSVTQIETKIEHVKNAYDELKNNIEFCQKAKEEDLQKIYSVEKLNNLDVDISKLYHLKYIKFRYGNISNDKLEEIKDELDNMNVIWFEVEKEQDIIWIVYVTTEEFVDNVDVFFNMQNFERVWLDSNLSGKPKEYADKMYRDMNDKSVEILNMQREIETLKDNCRHILLSSYRQLQTYDKINKIKKYIVHDSKNSFYLVAWVPLSELDSIINKLDTCQNIDYRIEEKTGAKSPTKLKNNKLIKPFEMLVKMYGMPNTNEIDPTLFVAITAFLMFGFMFGDVGHGLVFLIFGIILRFSKKDAGDIMIARGNFLYDFWIFIWKFFWKRGYYKSKIN